MNNQSSTLSLFYKTFRWIQSKTYDQARKVLNGKNKKPISPLKNEFAYSNFAHSSSENRRFALNHVRNRLKRKEKGDSESRLHCKLKKISEFWGRREENIQKQEELTCPICMDYLLGAISTNCGHTFCWRCIDEALLMNSGCPVCRKQIQGNEFRICSQLTAIIIRYLKKQSSEDSSDSEIHYTSRIEEFEEWLSNRLINVQKLKPSDLVDVRDTQNVWCSGLVKQIWKIENKTMLQIHYIGWSSVYDQILSSDSQRLASYRFYTSRKDIPNYSETEDEENEDLRGDFSDEQNLLDYSNEMEEQLIVQQIQLHEENDEDEEQQSSAKAILQDHQL